MVTAILAVLVAMMEVASRVTDVKTVAEGLQAAMLVEGLMVTGTKAALVTGLKAVMPVLVKVVETEVVT